MSTTISTVLADMRVRLDEPTADKWTDDQLIYYIAEAEQWLANYLRTLVGSGRFRYRESFSLPADTETYALSSLTKRFIEVISLQINWQNEYIDLLPLRDGDDGIVRGVINSVPGGIVVPRYTIWAETFKFLPLSSSARTIFALYEWLPSIKSTSGQTLETPADYDPYLITRAAHFALADAGVVNKPFEDEHSDLIAHIERMEQGRVFGASTETVRPRASRSLFM